MKTVEVDGRKIEISHPDRPVFPKDGITKADLADYYIRIAPTALKHYSARPLTMQRFPGGIGGEGFFQKNAPDYFPGWIERATLAKEGGSIDHVVVASAATLAYLANQGMVTPHLGLSRIDRIDHPDRMVIDLDPSDGDFGKVQETAGLFHDLFGKASVPCFVQTTGSRGLHVVVPLDRSCEFDRVREIARKLCADLAGHHENLLTVEQRKAKRGDRLYLDTGRNAYGQTAVAPYGVRAIDGAPVATPLAWSEALSSGLSPRRYTLGNIFNRLGQMDDPWNSIGEDPVPASELEGLAQ